jgi:16S rRNA (guanine966-N2)-methyltransferase
MRVVAGTAGGRRLAAPKHARPTTDRVREAVFSSLESAGLLAQARVLDLFCGSGAFGIEALSRGATRVTFVDDDRDAIATTTANVDTTGFAVVADIVRIDAKRFCEDHQGPPFDVAFADPPYAFDDWNALLDTVPARTVVVESDRPIEPPPGWRLLKTRVYGDTVVTLTEREE